MTDPWAPQKAELPTATDREVECELVAQAVQHLRPIELVEIVPPQDFSVGRYRMLWESLGRVARDGPVQAAQVMDDLEAHGLIEEIGGYEVLADVFGASAHGASALWYAHKVRERARNRRVRKEAAQAASSLEDPSVDVGELFAEAAERIAAERDEPTVDELEALHRLQQDGPDRGLQCGVPVVDALYRPSLGQLTVLTGVPGHGKTSVLDWYLMSMVKQHEWRVLFFTPERLTVTPDGASYVEHKARLIGLAAGEAFEQLDAERVENGYAWVEDRFGWLPADRATVDGILQSARARGGCDALVIDPWNWVESNKPKDVSTTEYIGQVLNALVRFGQEQRCHVFVVAHPRKIDQDEKGLYKVPKAYDIADSANWYNKPWWVLSVWRDSTAVPFGEDGHDPQRDPGVTRLHVQKVRDDAQGRPGVAKLRFSEVDKTFRSV